MAIGIARRQFISALGGTAVGWPLAARAQQPAMSRIGVLMAYDENDPVAKVLLAGFTQGLAELGCTNGRNLRMDIFWAGTNLDRR